VDAAPHYDPEMIEQYAARLYRRASSVRVGAAVAGVVIGAFFGAVPLTSLGEAWPIPHMFGFATLLVGAVVGGLIGFVVGDARATGYRLHAQASLCQLQAERNSAAVARAIEAGRRAALAAKAAAERPAPAPAAPPALPLQQPAPAAAPPLTPPTSPAPQHLAHTA
jgi:hypothetical protein